MKPLWERLGEVREARLAIAEGGTERHGSGTVSVDRPDPACIVWEERGTWNDTPGHAMPYRDRMHWKWDATRGVLALHHARRGDDAAVHLGDLTPGPDGTWRSVAPHLCGADTYDAALSVRQAEIVVVWRIFGPTKDIRMVRTYPLT